MATSKTSGRITVPSLIMRKSGGFTPAESKITCLTAFDYTLAVLLDQAGLDVILVGDSLGNVCQGRDTTLPVTLDEMIYHSRCVSRGVRRALVVGDMPFLSFQISPERAVESAGRLLKEGEVSAVKLEGGVHMEETISRLTTVDIPVMGHVGLTPQSFHRMGGYKIQGRTNGHVNPAVASRQKILDDALAVERAGAFAVVLEGVPAELAGEITSSLSIPTIGIGAGAFCDGQVLVSYDMLGLTQGKKPKFVKCYEQLGTRVKDAVREYKYDVEHSLYPSAEHEVSDLAPLTESALSSSEAMKGEVI